MKLLDVTNVRKAIAALVGIIGVVVTEVSATGTLAHYLYIASTVLSAALVYIVPNGNTPTPAPASKPNNVTIIPTQPPSSQAGLTELGIIIVAVVLAVAACIIAHAAGWF